MDDRNGDMGLDGISDCALPRRIRRPFAQITSRTANLTPTREELDAMPRKYNAAGEPVNPTPPTPVGREESPEVRTFVFRSTFLQPHDGGTLACSRCHIAPYTCQSCGALKCRCTIEGVYRHWKNGVPYPSMREAELMESM